MKLILISPSERKDSELAYLLNMFEQGLPIYHLRKTKFSTRELKNFIAEIPEKYHERIVIHTHHELVIKFNLKGIYISRSHKKRKYRTWLRMQWFKFKKRKLILSTSFRSIEDILDHNPKYDYVFLSPVFDSLSGNFQAGFSEHDLQTALRQTKYNVIARGGVSVDTVEKAKTLGFSGIAFYSSIWKSKNPLEEFKRVKEKFNELKIPLE
ncbi:MAG: thiamine phosphate synthase [Bacteroidetes bacterium]|nr:thiamine phosphate synthase [Bacteroidota bacterium]